MSFEVAKISDGFYSFFQRGVRAFLVEGSEKALLVDTCYEGELRKLCESLTDKPITVVITHSDPDHVGCVSQFDEFYMHPAEYSRYVDKYGELKNVRPVWEGDIFDLGVTKYEVVLLPGHTPGSIALFERDKRHIIGGDSVQAHPIYMFNSGRELLSFAASMDKLISMESEFDFVYSSHGQLEVPTNVIHELRAFALEAYAGDLPEAKEPEQAVPDDVKLFIKGSAQLLLKV